jgi:hypothetical protein
MGPGFRRDDIAGVATPDKQQRLSHSLPRRRSLLRLRHPAQTLRTQAVAGVDRHRQAKIHFGAPASAGWIAAELSAATGTGKAAGGRDF